MSAQRGTPTPTRPKRAQRSSSDERVRRQKHNIPPSSTANGSTCIATYGRRNAAISLTKAKVASGFEVERRSNSMKSNSATNPDSASSMPTTAPANCLADIDRQGDGPRHALRWPRQVDGVIAAIAVPTGASRRSRQARRHAAISWAALHCRALPNSPSRDRTPAAPPSRATETSGRTKLPCRRNVPLSTA